MNRYTFALVFPSGKSFELSQNADSEKEARSIIWRNLDDHVRDNIESIECLEEEENNE